MTISLTDACKWSASSAPKKPLAKSLLMAFIRLMSVIQVSQAFMRVP